MLFPAPSDDDLYEALVSRDAAYEGRAYVGVKSTGIFCRLVCPARNPKRENCVFFETAASCLEAGYRPCKRCRPLSPLGEAEPMVRTLIETLEKEPGRRWREDDLAAMGLDPSTVRRAFKRHFGITFLELARLTRLRSSAGTLLSGGRVIDAQLDAGFESASGFRLAFARVFGRAPATFSGRELLSADWIETPLGQMIAVADKQSLHLLEFFDRRALRSELAKLEKAAKGLVGIGRYPPIDQVEAELDAYFKGHAARFETNLAGTGSEFARRVWSELRAIPPGETRSYSEIAATIGQPNAVRAVARANGANQIAIIIPCHRVIGADGALTGYGGGLWRKRWLIDHERKHYRPVS
ncbi:MAG: trifunctional transcriptional activator/DNA repair protein Ada/methylated-DNA--[protein]-cysteine S-methyltransferase [Pseudomonadota bacterium]